MAYIGYQWFNDQELVNISRTVQLARALGIDTVRTRAAAVEWIEAAVEGAEGPGFGYGGFGFGGFGIGGDSTYDDVTTAPWYDAAYPASGEFAGFVPLAFPGLEDSTRTASPYEYITDGGNSGKARNSTLTIVGSMAIIASSERGAEYGKRWLDRVLRGNSQRLFCTGSDLVYFRYGAAGAPMAHRRNVSTTRGAVITQKRAGNCSATWMVTFTLTAADPYEYSDPIPVIDSMGGVEGASGDLVVASGSLTMIEESCPVFDYTPLYDPLYPALVPAPSPPNFYPDGWTIEDGLTFQRFWAEVSPVEPSSLEMIPVISLHSDVEARMVRVSIWRKASGYDVQCEPLFSVVVSYLPPALQFYIDSEQQASYVWDGASTSVRRADSLVYGPEAAPVQWDSFNDPDGLYVTVDFFATPPSGYEGDGDVRVALTMVQKSD